MYKSRRCGPGVASQVSGLERVYGVFPMGRGRSNGVEHLGQYRHEVRPDSGQYAPAREMPVARSPVSVLFEAIASSGTASLAAGPQSPKNAMALRRTPLSGSLRLRITSGIAALPAPMARKINRPTSVLGSADRAATATGKESRLWRAVPDRQRPERICGSLSRLNTVQDFRDIENSIVRSEGHTSSAQGRISTKSLVERIGISAYLSRTGQGHGASRRGTLGFLIVKATLQQGHNLERRSCCRSLQSSLRSGWELIVSIRPRRRSPPAMRPAKPAQSHQRVDRTLLTASSLSSSARLRSGIAGAPAFPSAVNQVSGETPLLRG